MPTAGEHHSEHTSYLLRVGRNFEERVFDFGDSTKATQTHQALGRPQPARRHGRQSVQDLRAAVERIERRLASAQPAGALREGNTASGPTSGDGAPRVWSTDAAEVRSDATHFPPRDRQRARSQSRARARSQSQPTQERVRTGPWLTPGRLAWLTSVFYGACQRPLASTTK